MGLPHRPRRIATGESTAVYTILAAAVGVITKGYGYADIDAATPATVYSIASVPSLFTALAILKLVDAGEEA
jgi:CubicO group peptidase (beta-lactamase class C family)